MTTLEAAFKAVLIAANDFIWFVLAMVGAMAAISLIPIAMAHHG